MQATGDHWAYSNSSIFDHAIGYTDFHDEAIRAKAGAIFAGIPVNVTLLLSCGQYLRAAGGYMRGIEKRMAPVELKAHAALVGE